MRVRTPLVIAAAAGALIAGSALPAMAAPGDTNTTFTLTAAGGLSVTPQATASLTGGAAGTATSASGSLGQVDISDQRGSSAGWTITAVSTAFTLTGSPSSTAVSYATGSVLTDSGTVTGNSVAASSVMTARTVATGTAAMGNNTAHFTPDLTVSLPSTALAGGYAGTVTTSIA